VNKQVLYSGVVAAVIGLIAFSCWKAFESSSTFAAPARPSKTTGEQVPASPSAVTASSPPAPPQSELPLRQRFREAGDYAQFVTSIAPLASARNSEAEYLTAKSLRWCSEMSRLYFRKSNGEMRTLEEVQANAAARPSGLSPEAIAMIHSRCRGFLEDPELRRLSLTWEQWLDKATEDGNPAAIALHASLLQTQLLLESHSSLSHPDRGVDAEAQARDLALSSVESGDPDAIFLMSDWVRTGQRTEQETTTLMYAWKILACQKGYDCGANSDWMLSSCSWNPQCADGRTYIDLLQRELGSQYDEAVRLAKSIGEAVASKDTQALKNYL
jgi:TPR repeat protein